MKLLTKEISRKMPKLYTHDGKPKDQVPVVAKFFSPVGAATWYITEGEPVSALDYPPLSDGSPDWMFYGLCDLFGDGGELGYVMLSDFVNTKLPFGLSIERDRNFTGTLADVMKGNK